MKKTASVLALVLLCCGFLAGFAAADENELLTATKYGDVEKIKALVEKGADVNAAEAGTGITPLIAAVLSGNADVVKLYLEKGAKVNARTAGGVTAIMAASLDPSKVEIAQLLIKGGAEVNEKTDTGVTPLRYATFNEAMQKDASERGADKGLQQKAAPLAAPNPMVELLTKSGAKE